MAACEAAAYNALVDELYKATTAAVRVRHRLLGAQDAVKGYPPMSHLDFQLVVALESLADLEDSIRGMHREATNVDDEDETWGYEEFEVEDGT